MPHVRVPARPDAHVAAPRIRHDEPRRARAFAERQGGDASPSVGRACVLALVALLCAWGVGCKRHDEPSTVHTTGHVIPLPTTSAPFRTPPVLPGTADIPDLVKAVRPGVVNITSTQEIAQPQRVDPFEFFFGRRGGGGGGGDRVVERRALGSGFIVDGEGHVATNAHVVQGASRVRVTLSDGRDLPAKVIGADPRLDVAVLEVSGAKDLPYLSLGSSDDTRVGEYVVAIGNPFGLGDTVTQGIVSAKGRELGAGPYDDFLQTDASINPGNSGGPLFNMHGQVIGINTAIVAEGKGIGFAIPVDALKAVLPQLLATGHVERGMLGVRIQPVDPQIAKALGLSSPSGALVSEVEPGSPASKAGLHPGDVIVAFDDHPIDDAHELPRLVARKRPGTKVTVEVAGRHGARARTLSAVLGALPTEVGSPPKRGGEPEAPSEPGLGIAIADDPHRGGVVVVGVDPEGPAAGLLSPGDVLLEVDGEPVKSARDAASRIRRQGDRPALLRLRHGGTTRFVAIERQR